MNTKEETILKKLSDDEIDFASLIRTLWLDRKTILVIGIIGCVLGLLGSQFSTKYVSEGILQTGSLISASNYKIYEDALSNGTYLSDYLKSIDSQNSTIKRHAVQLLSDLSLSPIALKKSIQPEFYLNEKDKKTLGVSTKSDESGSMIGLKLKIETNEPTNGLPLALLGDYVKESLLRLELEKTVNTLCLANRSAERSLRIAQIQDEFQTKLELARAKTLRGLSGKGDEVRQLMSIEKGGERYLSPQAQLNAVEITLSELQLAQIRRERELKQSTLRKAYYCEAVNSLLKPLQASAQLEAFQQISDGIFKDQDNSSPAIEQTLAELYMQRISWGNGYLRSIRFVAAPEQSELKVRGLSYGTGGVLGALLGAMLAVLFVFMRNWWKSQQAAITAA